MMRFNGKADRKTRSILVKGCVAFSNVKTACSAHMCPHLPPYAECVILSSPILHQCRFTLHTAKTRSRDRSEVVYNYLLQCISLWRGIHAGGGACGGGGGGGAGGDV